MTYKELRKMIDKLTEKQLNQEVKVWQAEERIRSDINLEIAEEDYVYHADYPDEGCMLFSEYKEYEGSDFDDQYMRVDVKKGDVFLWVE